MKCPRLPSRLRAAVVVLGRWLGLPTAPLLVFGAVLVIFLRLMALRHGWRLPVARAQGD